MDITKSSRHSKIIGMFGEMLVANWLSRSGWEVVSVDHTGIDIIAYHPRLNKRLGISVKSRTRKHGREISHVNLYSDNDREKILAACVAFGCEPWIAIYVETSLEANLFLTSLDYFENQLVSNPGKKVKDWKMRPSYFEKYSSDPNVHHIKLSFSVLNWFKSMNNFENNMA